MKAPPKQKKKKSRRKQPSATQTPQRFRSITRENPCPAKERTEYFRELYSLYGSAQWNHLNKWDKAEFFRLWFIAVSETYLKGYLNLYVIETQNCSNKNKSNKTSPLYEDIDDMPGFRKAPLGFNLSFDKETRNYLLVDIWHKNIRKNQKIGKDKNKFINFAEVTPFPPVAQRHFEEAKELFDHFRHYSDINASRLYWVNIPFPITEIMKELKKHIEHERTRYLDTFPKDNLFLKAKTENYTPRFDAWERYLKVYILKQMRIPNKTIIKQLYRKELEDPKKQISHACNRALDISSHALALNFPSKKSQE